MPELPEVETVRRGLEQHLVGRTIERVEVGRERVTRRTSPEALIHGLTGTRVTDALRRGKYLVLSLDSGEQLMIHLRMSGQVLIVSTDAERPAHTHVVAHLDDGHIMLFVDPRTFGEMVVFDPDRVENEIPELARLGPDPLTDPITISQFRAMLRRRHRQLKPLLLDQTVIAGIGNIYADEILHRARLRPDRRSDELTTRAERRLYDAIFEVLNDAIQAGGSTLSDAQYVDLEGATGSYQDDHRVYGRGGERCSTCGTGWVRVTTMAQRSTHYCPRCQR